MNQRADAAAARELIEQAVEVLADEEPDVRFEAFQVAAAGRRTGSATPMRSSSGRSSASRPRGLPTARTRSSRSP